MYNHSTERIQVFYYRSFSLSGTSCESPWYIQLTWCLYNLNNVVSLTITLSYYGLLTVGKTPPPPCLPPRTPFPPRTSIAFDLFLPVVKDTGLAIYYGGSFLNHKLQYRANLTFCNTLIYRKWITETADIMT